MNIRALLEDKGHSVLFLYRDYGDTLTLAKELGLKGVVYARTPGMGFSKVLSFPLDVLRGCIIAKKFHPDVVADFGIYGALVGRLLRKPCVVFTDSEPSINRFYSLQYRIFVPLVRVVVTPRSFRDDLGPRHIRVDSFKELAYLHPDSFEPKGNVLNLLGMKDGEHYALLRFNDLAGVHDIGLKGFILAKKIELVKRIEATGLKVFVSTEGDTPKELRDYIIRLPKSSIHDVLFIADLLVTDTQTMATEAAVLGTPVIRCNTFVGEKDMGNFKELERHGLMFNYSAPDEAIRKAVELAKQKDIKAIWREKSYNYFNSKVDISKFIVRLVETIND